MQTVQTIGSTLSLVALAQASLTIDIVDPLSKKQKIELSKFRGVSTRCTDISIWTWSDAATSWLVLTFINGNIGPNMPLQRLGVLTQYLMGETKWRALQKAIWLPCINPLCVLAHCCPSGSAFASSIIPLLFFATINLFYPCPVEAHWVPLKLLYHLGTFLDTQWNQYRRKIVY